MRRVATLVLALLIAAAVPARAWCEANCLTANSAHQTSTTHCPLHESSNGPALTAADGTCPVLETARPLPAKIDGAAPAVLQVATIVRTAHLRTRAPQHPSTQAPRHPGSAPLRI